MIPACLWFLTKNKVSNAPSPMERAGVRSRRDEILFIDARKLGTMVNRRSRELTDTDLKQVSDTYHNWRKTDNKYEDVAGFCKVATLDEVRENGYVLMPGRYVGTEEEIADTVPFADKMQTLTTLLAKQFAEGDALEKTIRENLKTIGFEIKLN